MNLKKRTGAPTVWVAITCFTDSGHNKLYIDLYKTIERCSCIYVFKCSRTTKTLLFWRATVKHCAVVPGTIFVFL